MLDSVNISAVVRHHLDGFKPPGGGKLRRPDIVVHYVVPLVVGVLWALFGPATDALGNLVAGLAVLTGLFFGLLVYVFQLRLETSESVEYQRSSQLIALIDTLFHNTVYATLVGGVTTVAAVSVDLVGLDRGAGVGLVVALSLHLVLTAALIIRRASAAYTRLVEDRRRSTRFHQ